MRAPGTARGRAVVEGGRARNFQFCWAIPSAIYWLHFFFVARLEAAPPEAMQGWVKNFWADSGIVAILLRSKEKRWIEWKDRDWLDEKSQVVFRTMSWAFCWLHFFLRRGWKPHLPEADSTGRGGAGRGGRSGGGTEQGDGAERGLASGGAASCRATRKRREGPGRSSSGFIGFHARLGGGAPHRLFPLGSMPASGVPCATRRHPNWLL